MAGNPLVAQGTLNRVKASVSWDDFPALAVTAPYLGSSAIRLSLQGTATKGIPTLTGLVQSPNVYQLIEVRMHLIKPQSLSDAYEQQKQLNSLLGDGIVRPDVNAGAGLQPFQILNGSIGSVESLDFSGETDAYAVTCTGYYLINSSLWD